MTVKEIVKYFTSNELFAIFKDKYTVISYNLSKDDFLYKEEYSHYKDLEVNKIYLKLINYTYYICIEIKKSEEK